MSVQFNTSERFMASAAADRVMEARRGLEHAEAALRQALVTILRERGLPIEGNWQPVFGQTQVVGAVRVDSPKPEEEKAAADEEEAVSAPAEEKEEA